LYKKESRELADRLVQSILAAQQELFSPKEVTLLTLSALFHDIVQEWEQEVSTMADTMPVVKRKRRKGYNEEQSALRLQVFLHEMNGWHNQEIFTEEDYALVQEAILATVPEYCEQLKTVNNHVLLSNRDFLHAYWLLRILGDQGQRRSDLLMKDTDYFVKITWI